MAFTGQTFSIGQILTASHMNQVDTNIDEVRTFHLGNTEPNESTPGVHWLDNTSVSKWTKKIRGSATFATESFIDPTANRVTRPVHAARVRKTSNQAIPDSTLVKLTWGNATFETEAIFNDANDSFDIPGNISKVRCQVAVFWESNDIGVRLVEIRKNGNLFEGSPRERKAAAQETETVMGTGVVQVSAGDSLTVHVFQTSGGSLNVINSALTWFSIELIE